MAKENVHPTGDPISLAIRLLTDTGYIVLKAPNWPRDLEITLERQARTKLQSGKNVDAAQTPAPVSQREFMTIREFCGRYSIGRSTAYEEIKSGRLKVLKIARSTRISERAATDWLNAWNLDRKT